MRLDTSGWLTKKQTATALSVSEKTVERWTDEHKLAPKFRKRTQDNRRELCFNPAEVEAFRAARSAQQEALNAVIVNEREHAPAAATVPQAMAVNTPALDADLFRNALSDFAQSLALGLSAQPASVPLAEKLMLTEREAALLAGVPRSFIQRMRHEGRLFAIRENGWRYRRSDLVKLIESLK